MKQSTKSLLLIICVVIVVAFDQWTKQLVETAYAIGEGISPIPALGDFFRIIHWQNTGSAFGLFQNGNLVLKVLVSLIIVGLVFYYFKMKESSTLFRIGLALAISGALGNLIDRFTRGYVADFIAVGRFPVFNVADSAVTIGVGLMILAMLLEGRKPKTEEEKSEIDNGKTA